MFSEDAADEDATAEEAPSDPGEEVAELVAEEAAEELAEDVFEDEPALFKMAQELKVKARKAAVRRII